MEIKNGTFTQVLEISRQNNEGIVLLGCGGDLQEWVNGVSEELHLEDVINTREPDQLWEQAIRIETTRGRIDLALMFHPQAQFDMGKMTMWRLQFGDCSWLSDYVVNYRDQHTTV